MRIKLLLPMIALMGTSAAFAATPTKPAKVPAAHHVAKPVKADSAAKPAIR